MTLNNNGYITRFYKWTYGKWDSELPTNFCNYFWATIFALVILPLTIWSLPIQYIPFLELEDNDDWAWFGRIGAFVSEATIGGLIFGIVCLFIFATVAALSLFVGIPALIFLLYLLFRENSKVREITGEFAHLVAEKTSSTKEKYCPRITWMEEK